MKNLFLVRHAKAETMNEYDSDFSRPLIKKGLKDAQKMADAVGMDCWKNDSMNRFFSQILFFD